MKGKKVKRKTERKASLTIAKRLALKGMTGKVLTILLTIIVAIAALIVLYFFFNKSIPFITEIVDKILSGLFDWIVKILPEAIKSMIGGIFGNVFKGLTGG